MYHDNRPVKKCMVYNLNVGDCSKYLMNGGKKNVLSDMRLRKVSYWKGYFKYDNVFWNMDKTIKKSLKLINEVK